MWTRGHRACDAPRVPREAYDLLAVAVVGLALVPLALLAVTGAARNVLGLLFVLFLPGYALVAALFPKDGEIDGIDPVGAANHRPADRAPWEVRCAVAAEG